MNESCATCSVAAKVAAARAPPKSITTSEGIGMHAQEIAMSTNTARYPWDTMGWVRACSMAAQGYMDPRSGRVRPLWRSCGDREYRLGGGRSGGWYPGERIKERP